MKIAFAVLAACTVVVAACSGDDDAVSPNDSSVSFTYTGGAAASATDFTATGAVPTGAVDGSLGSNAFAVGSLSTTGSSSAVAGVVPRDNSTYDMVVIGISLAAAGTSPINATCDASSVDSTDFCTGVAVLYGFSESDSAEGYLCGLTTGSVSITSISDKSMAGTFSGSGTCYNVALDTEGPFSITNGVFNVTLSSDLLL